MYKLTDGRDKDFKIITSNLDDISYYLGYEKGLDFYDLSEKLEIENAGMNFYHVEEIEKE